ncbi:Hypothetical predicted protein [Octopus vulgaris]|uniref:Uncharacterized protein n=1 Tax=Octopus vulgaris TaxID=6645 RepID=A0AA36BP45_OCTVU|nr:Hypothetical predicted protein [Octopus vulgaris]
MNYCGCSPSFYTFCTLKCDKSTDELDFELRELKEVVQNNLSEIIKIAQHYDESISESLELYLKQANLPIPSPTGVLWRSSSSSSSTSSSRTYSASSSSRSSVSQREAKQLALVTVGAEIDESSSEDSSPEKLSAVAMSSSSRSSCSDSSEARSKRMASVRTQSTSSSDLVIIGSGHSVISEH